MARRAALLRWTGRGNASSLRSSVQHVLKERRVAGEVRAVGGSLAVSGPEPVGVCSIFENMPGVAWTAAGFEVEGADEVAKASSSLAASYLKKGTRFSVRAEGADGLASDLAGAMTSTMLGKVKGARASDESPSVRFRAALDGAKGVVGAEVSSGPGGTPMGEETAVVLVSGGKHSSVLAWDALLLGHRVTLVHAATGEASLRAVARLYSELSNRGDPRGLALAVLDGGTVAGTLSKFVAQCADQVHGGFTAERPVPGCLGRNVQAPLWMMPEEEFDRQFGPMRLRSHEELADWGGPSAGRYTQRTFGGRIADVNGVLDGLR
ncbi:MAG: hypothetical protein JRN08_07740 [Nitrososphaerota archaeon]|nr:hypothetical protein [Nitrososphaerota archaeon]